MYTQDQLQIELLKHKTEFFTHTLVEIKTDMKNQFYLVVGLILGIYGIIAAAALGKMLGAI